MRKNIPVIVSIIISLFLFFAILTILIDDYRNAITENDWIVIVVNTTLLIILGIFLASVNYSIIKLTFDDCVKEHKNE